ncbi:hypothetical protein GWN26_15640, partial [Candidatus Saccharibacteria bacterium]|nr:sulfotransferase [Candidatus Saccharibacteria bacterium]NIV04533.1 hypothetical protein [Calditrichia bacterium]NIS39081.1 sulfotransferase [Candidatus Saccharibacteria bacterium]NIV72548.1 hypothetical protein [Calditrichia bacterium]NIW00472.1 hypothetical protein [Candidatus Saccharibacteria bacterium]
MNNFLIIGTSRSGTSLLHSIVNSHSQITCDFESTNWMKGDRTRQE